MGIFLMLVVRNNFLAVARNFRDPASLIFSAEKIKALARTAKKPAAVQVFLNAVRPLGLEPRTPEV